MPPKKGYRHTPEARAAMSAGQRARTDRLIKQVPAGMSYHRAWKLKTRFGLDPEDYEEMLEKQDGRCAICGSLPDGQHLSVDHNHETGDVRGLLCQPCNLALGHLERHLSSAFVYLGGDSPSRN